MIRLRSVRFRLLAAVNAAIVLLLGAFLILDYRREIAERVAEKHVALEEEAKTSRGGHKKSREETRGCRHPLLNRQRKVRHDRGRFQPQPRGGDSRCRKCFCLHRCRCSWQLA